MTPALTHIRDILLSLRDHVRLEIIGQDTLIEKLLITVFAPGHALLEGVPGLGKTKTIRALSETLSLETKRVSFTPDLLPSDLTGNEIYRPKEGKFEVRKGPIFTNILLADEINRTPPKVQSALLEGMEERRVTLGDKTFDLPTPFVVFATQNPLEHEGTYPLPEAELDRFLMKIILEYPTKNDEKKIFMQETNSKHPLKEHIAPLLPEVSDIEEIIQYIADNIHVEEKIYEYITELITSLRKLTEIPDGIKEKQIVQFPLLAYGPSTRAGLSLIRAARVRALFEGRDYVLPDDIKFLATDILRHRIGLTYEAMSEGITTERVITQVLDQVRVP